MRKDTSLIADLNQVSISDVSNHYRIYRNIAIHHDRHYTVAMFKSNQFQWRKLQLVSASQKRTSRYIRVSRMQIMIDVYVAGIASRFARCFIQWSIDLRNTKVLGSDCDLSRARKRQGGIFR